MEPFNAVTSRAITAYEDLGPTQPSTSGASHSQKSQPKSVPARIKLLIADLGLRYRPAAAADLEAHGSALALLAMDLADLPSDRLDRAIAAWVRGERRMPKASELIALCQRHQAEETYFRQSLDQAILQAGRTGGEIAVLCLDLDRFKGVNDTLGHPVGDALLKAIGALLTEGAPDGLVSRLGGDEYAIILAGQFDPDRPRALAQSILDMAPAYCG